MEEDLLPLLVWKGYSKKTLSFTWLHSNENIIRIILFHFYQSYIKFVPLNPNTQELQIRYLTLTLCTVICKWSNWICVSRLYTNLSAVVATLASVTTSMVARLFNAKSLRNRALSSRLWSRQFISVSVHRLLSSVLHIASSSIESAQPLWCTPVTLDLMSSLCCADSRVTQKTLWNPIWVARASRLKHFCRNLIWIAFPNQCKNCIKCVWGFFALHILKNQSGYAKKWIWAGTLNKAFVPECLWFELVRIMKPHQLQTQLWSRIPQQAKLILI